MGNFSKQPDDVLQANLSKGYAAIHIEQGVPLLDRDLNLMHDLAIGALRSFIAKYIGDGVLARSSGFAIQAIPADNDFLIQAGSVLVNGIEVTNPAGIRYKALPGAPPPLTTPLVPPPSPIERAIAVRADSVYLDVSLSEADGSSDPDLRNPGDIGLQTSVRQKVNWTVRVAEGVQMPSPAAGHTFLPLARLTRPAGLAEIRTDAIADSRRQIMSLADTSDRLRSLGKPFLASPGFSPGIAAVGASVNVTISGRNFDVGPLKVSFVSATAFPATIVSQATDNQVIVAVPVLPVGGYRIRVENDLGSDISDEVFTLLPPAPVFAKSPNQFTPKSGPAGTIVTLSGSNFDSGLLGVRFANGVMGSLTAPITSPATKTGVTVQVPVIKDVSQPFKIIVDTTGGSVGSDDSFLVLVPPAFAFPNPFTPKSGAPGTTVSLIGSNFIAQGLSVLFGAIKAPAVALNSPGSLTVTVPAGVTGPVKITIITDGGQAVSIDTFTVLPVGPPPPIT